MIDRFDTFATTISQLNRLVQQIKSREMQVLQLKGTHVMCLYHLGKQSAGLTAAELCRLCGEDKAAISRTVNELAALSYISIPQGEKKRAYRAKLTLTEKGTEALCYINERINRVLDAVGEILTEQQRETFYYALDRVSGRLSEYLDELEGSEAEGD